MHGVVVDSLEEYLSGTLDPAGRGEIEAHLLSCAGCREEISGLREIAGLFGSLRTDEDVAPGPGFYAGVMRQVRQRPSAPAFGGLFGLDLAFGRRLVFASLLTLAVMGSYLVTRETQTFGAPSAEVVMAEETSPVFEAVPAQDRMLITLAAYER
jgi:anti-sigma factor RsiW